MKYICPLPPDPDCLQVLQGVPCSCQEEGVWLDCGAGADTRVPAGGARALDQGDWRRQVSLHFSDVNIVEVIYDSADRQK